MSKRKNKKTGYRNDKVVGACSKVTKKLRVGKRANLHLSFQISGHPDLQGDGEG